MDEYKKKLLENPDVVTVGTGYRYRGGEKTGEVCVVVGVKKKLPKHQIGPGLIIPQTLADGRTTDVQEKGVIKALSNVGKMRPCPPGYSIGHWRITAGTLGCLVKIDSSEDWYILSNNHVLANSNDALLNDIIRQPGRADGGFDSDMIGRLHSWVKINFDGGGGKDGKKAASVAWKAWKAPANAVAKLVNCPYRLAVTQPGAIEQPSPNLVDAAIAKPTLQNFVKPEIHEIGVPLGVKEFELGEPVKKSGRTTEYTEGTVEGVDVATKVQYGSGVATFDGQYEIHSADEFSAGGDSGSTILGMDNFLGALLFAGGSSGGISITIGNKMSDVFRLLGLRL